MATSDDVRELVAILDEEGFGVLAGEILSEINLGREVEKSRQPLDGEEAIDDTVVRRVPIPEDEQIAEAISIIRDRLIYPLLAFWEAEQLAGQVTDRDRVRIKFVDPEQEGEPLEFFCTRCHRYF